MDVGGRGQITEDAVAEALDLLAGGRIAGRRELSRVLGDCSSLVDPLMELSLNLARWRQKEREHKALLESASELAQVRDPQRLLQKLVDRAQTLLGCDLTYLSEYDPSRGELRVRASRGAVSADLQHLRVPPGIGLAAKVVDIRAPYWTACYEETELPRADQVDAVVTAESMRSMLGVPMVVDDEVLGVLFAADRYPHTFNSDEIALLSALADHASMVVQTARLMGDLSKAAATSAHARDMADDRAALLQDLVDYQRELTQLVLAGVGVQSVLDVVANHVSADLDVMEAWVDGGPSPQEESALLAELGISLDELREVVGLSREAGGCASLPSKPSVVASAIASEHQLFGALIIRSRKGIDDVDGSRLAYASQALALIAVQEEAAVEAEGKRREELAEDLIAKRRTVGELRSRGVGKRLDLTEPWNMMVIACPSEKHFRVRSRLAVWSPGALQVRRSGGITALISSDLSQAGKDAVDERKLQQLEGCLVLYAGDPVMQEDLSAREMELWSCVEVLQSLGVQQGVHHLAEYAPYTVLFGSQPHIVQEFVESAIGPLRSWDADHASQLVETLAEFLDNRASSSATATALSIHVNTLRQRLERVDALIGTDWRSQEAGFRYHIALRLEQIARKANKKRCM